MGDVWALPKPIRYEEYQFNQGSYVVAGAILKCDKMEDAKKIVELSALYRGANTGYDIKAMDIDRKPENFCPTFGICVTTGEKCVLSEMEPLWHNPDKGLGHAIIKTVDVNPAFIGPILPLARTTIYPLSMQSKLPCFHGEGVITIEKNGQQQYLAMGKFNSDGIWDYANPNDEKIGRKLAPNPRNLFFIGAIPRSNLSAYNGTLISFTNCYAYAFDMLFDPLTGKDFPKGGNQPGLLGKTNPKINYMSGEKQGNEELIRLIENDMSAVGMDFIPYNLSGKNQNNGYVVALVVKPDEDYHWYRQNSNGTWSHKRGQTLATNMIDEIGGIPELMTPITDPFDAADKLGYTVHVGYFYVKEK